MKVAIFGFGNVGQQLAQIMADAGQDVVIASRDLTIDTKGLPVMTFADAAASADAIVIAIHYAVAESVLRSVATFLTGKIVVDATNPLQEDWSPLLTGEENSAGEMIQHWLPESQVVKAFNTIFADVMSLDVRRGLQQPLAAFMASDYPAAKNWLQQIMQQAAFYPVDAGPLKSARYLEAMAHLNIELAVGQGGGTQAGFVYSRL